MARIERGAAGKYWSRLTAVDFMNSSFAFAVLAVVSSVLFFTWARSSAEWNDRRSAAASDKQVAENDGARR